MEKNVKAALQEFVDLLESEYGNIEGFEVRVEHPIVDGERQRFADIKEFVLIYLTRQQL
jgi:hypothetical protein